MTTSNKPCRRVGEVLWYSKIREYGFAAHPDVDQDIFFHRKDIARDTKEHEVKSGKHVSFYLKAGEQGPRALDVTTVEGDVR